MCENAYCTMNKIPVRLAHSLILHCVGAVKVVTQEKCINLYGFYKQKLV